MKELLKENQQNSQSMQERTLQFWKDSMSNTQPSNIYEEINEPARKMLHGWRDNQESILNLLKGQEKMSEMFGTMEFPEIVKHFCQDWHKVSAGRGDLTKYSPIATRKETFERVMQGLNVYTSLLTFWTEMKAKMPGEEKGEKRPGTYQNWTQDYNRVLESFFKVCFPELLRGMLMTSNETHDSHQQFIFRFFQPWLGSSDDLKKSFVLALKGDRESYLDFLKKFKSAFHESYGNTINLPSVGLTRKNVDKLMGSMEAFTEYVASSNEIMAFLYETGYEVWENLMKRVEEMNAEGEAPESFIDLYQMWWQINEKTYLHTFNTEGFSKLLSMMTESGFRFKERFDSLMSDLLGHQTLPNHKEIYSLEKSLCLLKNTVKAQSKGIEEIIKKLESLERRGVAKQP